jgi:hypothetical protein
LLLTKDPRDMQMIEDELEKLEPKLNAMSLERATRVKISLVMLGEPES